MKKIIFSNQEIHNFAIKWLAKYKDPKTPENELEERFAGECFSLGFEMDCGKAFESVYSSEAFHNVDDLKKISSSVQNVQILGNAVFSKWRYYTHWACSALDREWFIIAFSRLDSHRALYIEMS